METRNLCAQVPLSLHTRVCEERERAGMTIMAKNSRTMAFQIPEELFQRIKAHLERETIRTGRKLTQREFVLGLIEEALDAAERREESDTACEAPSAPEEARAKANMSAGGGDQKSKDAKSGLVNSPNPISPVDTRKEMAQAVELEKAKKEIRQSDAEAEAAGVRSFRSLETIPISISIAGSTGCRTVYMEEKPVRRSRMRKGCRP